MNTISHPSRFVQVCEQWRVELGMSHSDWLRYIGRIDALGTNPARTEWASLRAGRRMPSASFVALVRAKVAAKHPDWLPAFNDAYFEDFDARHTQTHAQAVVAA